MLRTSAVWMMLILAASLQADEPITHSFFIAGPTFTGIIAEDGTEEWNADKPATTRRFHPAKRQCTHCLGRRSQRVNS